jgi:hypothetical protein
MCLAENAMCEWAESICQVIFISPYFKTLIDYNESGL